ncbi:MAG: hypothetical protein IPK60_21180 [Sandaracinaceae bacterium]|nr:hypothetical protein [Sandaracinaceae bacterium]
MDTIVVDEFEYGGRVFRMSPPIVLEPMPDEDDDAALVLRDDEFRILVFGASRAELVEELHACLVFEWDEYALADEADLSPGARALKAALLARMREVRVVVTKGVGEKIMRTLNSDKADRTLSHGCAELDPRTLGVSLPPGIRLFDARLADDADWPRTPSGRALIGSEVAEYVLGIHSPMRNTSASDLRDAANASEAAELVAYYARDAANDVRARAIVLCNYAVALVCDSGRGDPWANSAG